MELAYSGYRDMAERNLAPRHPFSSPPLRPPLPPPAPHHHHHPPLQIPQPGRRSQCKGTPGGARKGGEAWEGGLDPDHGAPIWTTRPRLGARRQQGGKESGAGSAPGAPGVRFCSLSRQDKSGVTPPRAVPHNELTPPLLGGSPGTAARRAGRTRPPGPGHGHVVPPAHKQAGTQVSPPAPASGTSSTQGLASA